jgi:hypothetical protein
MAANGGDVQGLIFAIASSASRAAPQCK